MVQRIAVWILGLLLFLAVTIWSFAKLFTVFQEATTLLQTLTPLVGILGLIFAWTRIAVVIGNWFTKHYKTEGGVKLTFPEFSLRVNGMPCEEVEVRFRIVDGFPAGPREIAITDPIFGQFTLNNDFIIELQQGASAPWERIRVAALVELLVAMGDRT